MAGENVDVTGWTEANKNLWMDQVEGFLSCFVEYDISTNFTNLDSVSRGILTEYAARYCACCGILTNTAGYTSLSETENMINFNAWRMRAIEKQLEQGSVQAQLGVAA